MHLLDPFQVFMPRVLAPLVGLAKNSKFWCDVKGSPRMAHVLEVGQLQLLHVRAASQVVLAQSMSFVTILVGSQRCGRTLTARRLLPRHVLGLISAF